MRSVDAFAELRRLGKPVVTTEDAALRLRISLPATSRALGRMASRGLIRRLRRGIWSLDPDIDPFAIVDYLTAPLPSYVSLQSALYRHGMISQIPQVVFAVSLAGTRRIPTSIATYSIHQVVPQFFGGWHVESRTAAKIATCEKALVDVLDLTPARSRLFARLPELELPRRFSVRECRRWIARIPADHRRTIASRRLDDILARAGRG